MLERKYTEVEGIRVQYWEGGSGFPILMLHGVGPGTSIQGNYGPVLEPLSEHCRIVAADLIGFGGSDRKPAPPYFDVDLWVRQALAMLGPAAARAVRGRRPLARRCARPEGRGPEPTHHQGADLERGRRAPTPSPRRSMRSGRCRPTRPRCARRWAAWCYDQAAVTDAMIDDRWGLISSGDYADYFAAMFAAPRQRYLDAAVRHRAGVRRDQGGCRHAARA